MHGATEPWLRPGFCDDFWAEGFNEANLQFRDEIDRMRIEEGLEFFYGGGAAFSAGE